MKKRNLLSVLLLFIIFSVSAQNKEWIFSDDVWNSANVGTGATVDELTNYSENSKASIGDSNKAYILEEDEYAFTKCFKFGEIGSFNDVVPESGVISFNVTGNATISVIGTHASSSGDARELVVAAKVENELSELGSFFVYQKNDNTHPELQGQLNSGTFTYEGAATTIYIYSRIGGVNLYLIKTSNFAVSGIEHVQSGKYIKSVEYFDFSGKKLGAEATGLLVEKTTSVNGTVSTQKVMKK